MDQAHFSRGRLPIADYKTDTKSVLDQCIRILQAMIDVSADQGYMSTALLAMNLVQMVVQGAWLEDSTFRQIPNMDERTIANLTAHKLQITTLPELMHYADVDVAGCISLLSATMSRYLNWCFPCSKLTLRSDVTSMKQWKSSPSSLQSTSHTQSRARMACLSQPYARRHVFTRYSDSYRLSVAATTFWTWR